MTHEEREQTLNQLLVELDGFDTRVGVILMAATNRPEILDPALLRAGRFDCHVLVDRPDRTARLQILKLHATKVPIESPHDLEIIAAMTAGFVGADLANIINEAALLGVRRDRERVGMSELQEAVERIVAGLEKKNRVLSPAEKKRVAHHELGHALVALSFPNGEGVHKISIIPRGISALGYTMQAPTEDRFLMTESELKSKVATLLGAAPQRSSSTTRSRPALHDDLQQGDGHRAQHGEDLRDEPPGRTGQLREGSPLTACCRRPASPSSAATTASRPRARSTTRSAGSSTSTDWATEILSQRHEVLLRAAQVLLAKETITGDELRELLAASEPSEHATDTSRTRPTFTLSSAKQNGGSDCSPPPS